MTSSRWRIWCDGAASPDGALAVGALLQAPGASDVSLSSAVDGRGDGNHAEAWAMIVALEHAHACGARVVEVFSDSDVVVKEARGERRTEVPTLASLCHRLRQLLAQFDEARVSWVPRHKNAAADALAGAALSARRAG